MINLKMMPNQDTYPSSPEEESSEIRPMISPRRKKGRSNPKAIPVTGVVGLSPRQWEILQVIPRFNGMVRLYQLRLLLYPFHLDLVLNMMIHNLSLARRWIERHEACFLYSLVEYAKLLQHLNRLYDKGRKGELLTQTKDIDLWTWFEQVETNHRSAAKLITTHRRQLRSFINMPMIKMEVLKRHQDQLAKAVSLGGDEEHRLLVTNHLVQVIGQQQELLNRKEPMLADQRVLEKLALNQWVIQAIEAHLQPPDVFESRTRYASGIVNREVRDEVNDLIDRGLVDSYLPAGGGTTCIYLSKKGRRAVAKQLGFGNKASKVRWHPVRTYVYDMLGHKTAQNDFRIAMMISTQQKGFVIHNSAWMDTPDLDERLSGVTVKVPVNVRKKSGETAPKTKNVQLRVMDDFTWVDTSLDWVQPMAIEIENGSRTIDSDVSDDTIAMKYRTWAAFCQSHALKEYFEGCEKGAWFLTITTKDERRLRLLQQAMMKVVKPGPARDRYWFVCLDRIHPSWRSPYEYSMFTQPIWLRGDIEEFVVMDLVEHARRQHKG